MQLGGGGGCGGLLRIISESSQKKERVVCKLDGKINTHREQDQEKQLSV